MNKGFITIPVLVIAVLGLIVVGGGGYTAIKFNELQKANIELSEKVSSMNEPQAVSEEKIAEIEVVATTSDSSLEEATSTASDDKDEEREENKVVVEQKIVYVPVKTESPAPIVIPEPVEMVTEPEEVTAPAVVSEYLKIKDVKVEVDAFVVNIYWKTNKEADSRVVIDGDDIFVSDNHDSTEHHVKISSLDWSSNYAFEIIAEVDGEKDTFFDNVATERKFNVIVTDVDTEDKCIEVYVIDTKKLPLQYTLLRISGAWRTPSGGTRYISDTIEDKTNNEGRIDYCGPISEMKVENVKTRDVYYNGTFTIL